ncbi:receptor-type tyrosine-protein phosphatase alpha-like, partial [Biomphalaria glabrata]|uniref:protein-tyrosine-phosphatase n=1 Tax=Biomphalaria glabrata TaxID=6526 RepID=A0A9W3ABC4_BIOGL
FAASSANVGTIVGSIIAIIIVAVLVAVGAIIWKRKYYKKPDLSSLEEREFTRLTPEDSITVQEKDYTSTEQNGDATYCNFNIAQVNTKIAVDNLNDYLLSHKDEFLIEQYRSVPKPKNVTTDVGVSEENRLKNRYKNICPYDHSRVHLMINTEKQEGDYINASYVRGDSNDVKFIAAQGPFSIVVNDFVRMLWEQKIEKVVMLTNLIEEGKTKCDKYWPDSGKTMFGDIKVRLIDTESFADYTIRKLQLEKKDAASRLLTHYHFTSWPDQGVPMTPWALVDFEQRVDINSSTAPVVVHCSAGVGRTGTFIALHNIMSQAMHTGHIDFYNTLVKLREDRFLMIQTPDQYVFLHKAAQAAIVSMGTTVTSIDSQTRFNHLQQKTMTGMSNMENEFQSICAICKNETGLQKEDDLLYQNTETLQKDSKNRFSSIVPKDCYRPFLQRDSKDMGDYINAVFVQGFHKKDQQILTQLPMPLTLVSFWKLVTQYKVSLIVAFDTDKMSTDQTIANYLPSSEKPFSAPPYEIQSTDLKEENLWVEQNIKVVNQSSKIEHSVIHLKCKVHDPDAMRLLTFVNKSRSYNALVKGRILYTCRDGATYSGLACVLSLLLDRMDHDTCWTVPLVVGSVKSIRPQVIPTFKQYNTLHDALQKYNEMNSNDNTYGNVDENFFPKYLKSTRKEQVQSLEESEDGNIYSNID